MFSKHVRNFFKHFCKPCRLENYQHLQQQNRQDEHQTILFPLRQVNLHFPSMSSKTIHYLTHYILFSFLTKYVQTELTFCDSRKRKKMARVLQSVQILRSVSIKKCFGFLHVKLIKAISSDSMSLLTELPIKLSFIVW